MGWLLAVVAGVVLSGALIEHLAARRDRARFPPRGRMVDVGGFRLHLDVSGDGHPGPTVILDAGMVSFSSNWAWVAPEIARVAPVVAYDRAGLGWSDRGPASRDAGQSARDLHAALQALGVSGPYVYAGHSYGGLVAQAFAALYSDQLAGLVLVDGSNADQWNRLGVSSRMAAGGNRLFAFLARFGLWRLLPGQRRMLAAGLPEPQRSELAAFAFEPDALAAGGDALAVWDTVSRPLIREAAPFGELPLVVISVTENAKRVAETLTALQRDLLALSRSSRQVVVRGATHEGLLSRREHARVVTETILELVDGARRLDARLSR